MLKKNITYTDFNDVERSEDFFFNLTKAELTDMQLGTVGGFNGLVDKIMNTQDVPEIMKLFKEIIVKSYGEKSLDGKRFMKTPEIVEAFTQTEAFSVLYMELSTNAEAAGAFITGIVPADVAKAMAEAEKAEKEKNAVPKIEGDGPQ